MTSLVDRGFALLNRATQAAAGLTVRYTRDATVVSDELKATLAAPEIAIVTEGGSAVVGREFRFSIYRPDFVIDAAPIKPRRGDVIEWTPVDVVYVFQVLPESVGVESNAVDPRKDWLPVNVKLVEVRDA